jgi:hypothetical protein
MSTMMDYEKADGRKRVSNLLCMLALAIDVYCAEDNFKSSNERERSNGLLSCWPKTH